MTDRLATALNFTAHEFHIVGRANVEAFVIDEKGVALGIKADALRKR